MKHLFIALLFIGALFSKESKTHAQNTYNPSSELNTWIDSTFNAGLKSVNIAGATIVLMQGDSILHINGYGVEDIETNKPVNSNTSIFGIASVSKTFVATAVMKLYEDGKLELDRDINSYLKSFQIDYKFNDSITVRNLLTHTAGFDDCNMGTITRSEENLIPLAQYLKKRMSPQIFPANKAISYSNNAYALLGLIVEEVSGLPFHEYVSENILKPLNMNYSGFKRQAALKENYVTSYLKKGEQLIPYQPDFIHNYPIGSFSTTASDMGSYISMFLNNGRFEGIQLLDSTTVCKMHNTGFKTYKMANYGWLLGFSESQWYGVRTVGHSGGLHGFASRLTLIPEKNIGLFICLNSSNYLKQQSHRFIKTFINNLQARLLPEVIAEYKNTVVSPKQGSMDEPLEKLTGSYRYTRYSHTDLSKVGVLVGIAPEIKITAKDNKLEVSPWGDALVPVSGLTFQSKNFGHYLAFDKNDKGEITYFYTDAYSYQKLKWYEPLKFQILWIGSIVLILLIYIITNVVRKLFIRNRKKHLIKRVNFSLASLSILFISILAYALKTTDVMEFFYGIPLLIKIALVIPLIIIPLELFSVYLIAKAIKFKELKTFDLMYQTLITVVVVFFIPWLWYYNLIGFNY